MKIQALQVSPIGTNCCILIDEAEKRFFVKGLYDRMYQAYDITAMLSEML